MYFLIAMAMIAVTGMALFLSLCFRTVVPTNFVHIIQSSKRTVSYGKDQPAGNTYYKWPAWVPFIGIRTIALPMSVFDVQLNEYAAYDKGRVPFVIDILAFFRIEDSNISAQRINSVDELEQQLKGILQGASRSILAQSPIEEILEERAKYGSMFTEATNDQLKAWGVVNVKNIELMDIRDAGGSQVIQRIMAIKQSLIEKESRVQVALNKQVSSQAEIDADRAVAVRQQEAQEQVGVRTAQKAQQIGIADQQAQQAVKEQEKMTAEKHMNVLEVQRVRDAEIQRGVQLVTADQEKKAAIIRAEGEKQRTITIAEGTLGQAQLHAQGIEVEGKAHGAAEQAVLMAPVNAQITLAKEIGTNENYQAYLVTIKQIETNQVIGVEQAKALEHANIKIISNSGDPVTGLAGVRDLFTSKGGTAIGAMLEGLKNTPAGEAVLKHVIKGNGTDEHSPTDRRGA